MSDRIAVMREGRFVEVGTPEELWTRPRTVFTAQFLGGANIFTGDARLEPDGAVVQTASASAHDAAAQRSGVGVRAAGECRDRSARRGINRFDCTVVGQRFQGDMRDLELQTARAARVRCKDAHGRAAAGRAVTIDIRPEHVEVLSADDR